MILNKENLFIIWYFALWGTASYALFECFGHTKVSYGPAGIGSLFWFGFSFLSLFTVIPLILYLRKRKLSMKGAFISLAVFLVATLFLASTLVQPALDSAENKAKVQWYIDDLKSQGFNVEYRPSYGGKVFADEIPSYSELIRVAREINASTVAVLGGVPTFFMFFVPSSIILQVSGNGTYRAWISW